MKRFDPESKCKKCGSGNSYYRYFAAWGRTGECIRHLCRDCGFAWSEAPLDSAQSVTDLWATNEKGRAIHVLDEASSWGYTISLSGGTDGFMCDIRVGILRRQARGVSSTWHGAVVNAWDGLMELLT